MTDTATTLLPVDPQALGDAAATALAAMPGLVAEPVADGDAVPLPDEASAVAADLGGGARVVLVASPALTRQVQVGPPPAEDLVDGCTAALTAVAALAGATVEGAPTEVTAATALANAGETAVAARLVLGADHVATVVLVTPEVVERTSADDAPVHEFAPLPSGGAALGHTGLEVLHDVSLGVTAELGRTSMLVKDVLTLAPGSVIELDRAAGSPVDVLVNGTLIAKGEVVVIDEEFGIRITEVIGYADGAHA